MDDELRRFSVFDAGHSLIGRIDEDEFIRDGQGCLLYRIDGDEVYDADGNYLGLMVSGVFYIKGKIIFAIEKE